MRRRWILVSALAAVVAVGIGGGAVLAQSADTDERSPIRGFVSRVAEVLSIEETKVREAFDQAASDMKEEAVQAKLDAMEESGKITPEQREEWKEWKESMPDGLLHGSRGPFRMFRFNKHRFEGAPPPGGSGDAA